MKDLSSFYSLYYYKPENKIHLGNKYNQKHTDFLIKFNSIITGSFPGKHQRLFAFFLSFFGSEAVSYSIVLNAARQLPGLILNITDIAGDRPDKVWLLFCK